MSQENSIHLKDFYNTILSNSPIFLGHQFVVTFEGDIPDMIKSKPEDTKSITYYVKSAKVPAIDMKEHKISFLSQQFVVPGGVMYDGSWDVKVMITNDMLHYNSLYEWQEWYANLKNDGGASDGHIKAIPNVNAHVRLLDSTLQREIKDFVLVGIFPTNIPDLTMEYKNDATMPDFSCSFKYQYMYNAADGDPLAAS